MILNNSQDFDKYKEMLAADHAGKEIVFSDTEPLEYPCIAKYIEEEIEEINIEEMEAEEGEESPDEDDDEISASFVISETQSFFFVFIYKSEIERLLNA